LGNAARTYNYKSVPTVANFRCFETVWSHVFSFSFSLENISDYLVVSSWRRGQFYYKFGNDKCRAGQNAACETYKKVKEKDD
jgi:hypothetical protein